MSAFYLAQRAHRFVCLIGILLALRAESTATGTPIQKLQEALDKPTEAHYTETPLTEVINDLESQHAIEIEVDTRALSDVGITAEMVVVSRELHAVSLKSVLDLILRDHDLTYLIRDEVLLLTTTERARNEVYVELYRVADLAADEEDLDALREQISQLFAPDSPDRLLKLAVVTKGSLLAIRTDVLLHRDIKDFLQNLRSLRDASDKQVASSDSDASGSGGAGTAEASTDALLPSSSDDPLAP